MPASPRSRSLRVALTSIALCGGLVATAGTAYADHRGPGPVPAPGEPEVIADGLLAPLSLDAGNRSTVYVSENFGGPISGIRRGERTPVVAPGEDGAELGSVSSAGSKLYYTTSIAPGLPEFDSHLHVQNRRGGSEELADLGEYERTENPDADMTYGFVNPLDESCLAEFPEGFPVAYDGILDSHPYGSTVWHGTVFVADAGGNDILAVSRKGEIRTVAVLPGVELAITPEIAEAAQIPACAAGNTYRFESVPTDVEVGRDGWLYVTSLPGGPETGAGPIPPLGSVYKVHPHSGETHLVARAFAGATNLAIGTKGEIYVTEMFADRISVIPRGSSTPQPFLDVPFAAAVEVDGRDLYVSGGFDPFAEPAPTGQVWKVRLER
jgi:hypothetical protein